MSKWRVVALTTTVIIFLILLLLPLEKDYLLAREGERLWDKVAAEILSAIPEEGVDIVNQESTPLTDTVEAIAASQIRYNPDSKSRLVIVSQKNTFQSELKISFERKVLERWNPKEVFHSATARIAWWSLLPLCIILISLSIFGKIRFSLLVSLFVGGLILSNGNPITAITSGIFYHLISPLLVRFNLLLLLSVILLTGLFALISKLGGIEAIVRLLPFVKGRRGAQLLSISFSSLLFFDEYIRTVITAPIVRPFAERCRLSPEKLAFLINAFAAPLASILIFTTWFFFQVELFLNFSDVFGQNVDSLTLLMKSIPYRFYGIGIIIFSLFLAISGREFGPMLSNEEERMKRGFADSAEDQIIQRGSKLYGYLPLAVLISFIFISTLYFSGLLNLLFGKKISLYPAAIASVLSGTPTAVVLFVSIAFATIAILIPIFLRRELSIDETVDCWGRGVLGGGKYILLLLLAWGVASQIKDLGSGDYLVALLNERISIWFLPIFLIFISSTIAFTTGSALNAMSMSIPLILPFVLEMGEVKNMLIVLAAISDGAVIGQQLSPVAETAILTSLGSRVSHIKFLRLSIPYALSVMGLAIFSGYAFSLIGITPLISISVMMILLYGLIRYFGKVPGS
ncbi:MAG: hypothetical protein A3F16_07610 [Deltaproteobacteria bacterium RIFCSPHIGHO2_12_FULL_43_9]|nr:MAG: hypothetical protein A3F16_07610 [Deltaproteobacteria bacterium RIFCSPHIGHO2_12_FULL_43_9]